VKIVYMEANPGNGGAEEYALNLAEQAREAGHEVCFILGSATGAMVERVRESNFDMLIIPMQSSFNPVSVFNSVLKLHKYIRRERPDIIHTQMLREQSLVIITRLLGARTRLVRTFHRLDQFNGKMKLLLPIYRRYTDAYLAISEYVNEYLAENGIVNNVFVVNNGVVEVLANKKSKALGFLGRLISEKGIRQFIMANEDIFQQTPLVIAGDGPELAQIDRYVTQSKLKVALVGQITDKNTFFSKFNVLVLPSETEALPLVVLEAFSAGTPVVAFDLPSLRGLVDGQNGILVKEGEFSELAQVAIAISNGNDYDKFSRSARKTYLEKYTVAKMWAQTADIYVKIRAND